MAFVKKKRSVLRALRMIWNNLVEGWEVYDKATGALCEVQDTAGKVKDLVEDEREKLSKDYQDAERYVKEGISEAKDVWKSLKEAF